MQVRQEPSIRTDYSFLRKTKKLLIEGEWVESASGGTYPSINPATRTTIVDVAMGDGEDINRAVAAARRAFETGPWSTMTPYDRQNLLLRLADLVDANFEELATLATIDMGAPISRQMGFRRRAVGLLRYYASMAVSIHGETIQNSHGGDIFSYTLREPIGVVGAITPWNGPIPSTIWKLGPVLATGCTMVLKPAEEAPLVPLRLGELTLEAGIPKGVFNIVTGSGIVAGARLVEHPAVDKIAFTGSHVTGQWIMKASAPTMKRLTMELGGKSPNIVFADANLHKAIPGAAQAIFNNSGQICSAGSRLFVERSVYDQVVDGVAEYGKNLTIGNGLHPSTQIGPLVSMKQLDRVCGFFESGIREGARLVSGGCRLMDGELSRGNFVAPTVFADVSPDAAIGRDEIFGPVLTVFPFDTPEEVVALANNTVFGLGAGVWSSRLDTVHALARRIKSGVVWANSYQLADPGVPFGGYKMSGFGRESGHQHVEEYTNVKSVWISPSD
ncbi:aldehyde dehydrogenase family protein [Mesorhizobium sp. M2D.F.Ca.ET.185.01.1.1]|uniref:aldehyde dehydrogenase family protein n=1 Tax=unclassified Mesorhizobium TaxID=325217 RepID=UPI000FCCDCF1|nr:MULTISPECIES: aldehyde dehydrogenase family protein [unclassified Mesorhizobium]TGP77339.1 aldehyde dehydrogenase family protein [bacterium M00.F.Ca.ET.227.01.1.1]TGP93133.1 aldehyde dehydrogenase family protein [bacterium M00.F.Ca.ET.222.01.1.1]TGP96679.1 aldehyde dehydrogenase family protein [bacterium M00.F.Ca.ET.221.01.1.1]TGT96616.1 aldehyde dehydrogenase family protein [bacterium M00.F.Ca.ET.163.01.1.1]TGU18448.1 aldehyde dehydrogenase family protein [bacterium M00.F.Ca.ET.156.01.1.1]